MKKILIILVLLMNLITSSIYGADFSVNGIYYKTIDNSTVEVTKKPNSTTYYGSIFIPETVSYSSNKYTVTRIGYEAFYNSTVTSITLPNTISSISPSAFAGCKKLSYINIPSSVETIGSTAFEGCTSLPVIDNVRYADTYLVGVIDKECTFVKINETTVWIGYGALKDCSKLNSVTIPNSVKHIDNYAFYGCSSLESVSIPNSVIDIGSWAFVNCENLVDISISNSIANIGYDLFRGCRSLPVIDNIRYADTYLVEVVDKETPFASIKEGTRWIGSDAFGSCSKLEYIEIPNSITGIGSSAFKGCSSLTSIHIPESVTTIESSAFEDCIGLNSLTICNSKMSIGNYAFSGCYNVKEIVYAEGCTTTLPLGITTMNSVTISSSITKINSNAFKNCTNIKELIYAEGCPIALSTGITSLKSVIMPKSLTIIESSAFRNCKDLDSIIIPDSVSAIGGGAFAGCIKLTNVNLPESLTYIGNGAFSDCTSITSIIIPDSVTTLEDYAFSGCSNITSVIVGNSLKYIYPNTFKGCSNVTELEYSDGCLSTLETGLTSLQSIVIPESILRISSFTNCKKLTDIYYGGNKSQWEAISNRPAFASTICIHFHYGRTYPNESYYCNGIKYVVTSNGPTAKIVKNEQVYEGELYIPLNIILNGVNHIVNCIDNYAFAKCSALTAINYEGSKIQWQKLIIGKGNDILSTIPIYYNCRPMEENSGEHHNYVYIDKQSFYSGMSGNLSVGLKNEIPLTGLQFEMELPEGMTIENTNNTYDILLSSRTTPQKHNILEVSKLNNGRYLVICSSTCNATFLGNDGGIMNVNVNVDSDMEEGEHMVTLYNIALSTPGAEVERIQKMDYSIEITSAIPGDANGDKKLNVSDLSAIVGYILNNNIVDGFNSKAADINCDGKVNVSDLSAIVKLLLGESNQ